MAGRRVVILLGLSQLVCWGVTYYLIAVFGDRIAAELDWPRTLVYGGFSAALVVMGLTSPWVGRIIDERGGRPVMVAGSCLIALGSAGLSVAHGLLVYYLAWACLGLAMRMTLYDAAFAALARIGGPSARKPISQITLLGGLASTCFWPIGGALADWLGWRGALLCYAGFALLTIPLHLAIPVGRYERPANPTRPDAVPLAGTSAERTLAGVLYALVVTLTTFLNSGMSAHMIDILAGLGMAATLAVWVASLRGIGQSLARLCEVLFGGALSPLALGALATFMLPVCFVTGLYSGGSAAAAIAFAFLYGAGNGLLTIVRGTLPLALFDSRAYGALVGRLITPSFFLSALAPIAYAFVIEHFGDRAALHLSTAVGALVFFGALVLWARFRGARQ